MHLKDKIGQWSNEKVVTQLPLLAFSLLIAFSIPDLMFYSEYPIFEFLKYLISLLTISFLPAFFLLNAKKTYRVIGWILFALIFSLSLFYAIHHILYSAPPTANVYVSFFDTDKNEMLEYYESYFNTDLFLELGLYLIIAISLHFILWKNSGLVSKNFKRMALVFAILAPLTFLNLLNKSPLRMIEQFVIFQNEQAKFKKFFSSKIPDDLKVTQAATDEDSTVVVVIGESTSRRRLSLYGYYRETNPLLRNIKDELVVFKNVISPHSHTVASLQKVLSFLNFDNEKSIQTNANIIQIAKLANYKTYWLSNQIPLGSQETPLAAIANNADHSVFIADQKSYRDQKGFDGSLQPVLKKILKLPAKRKFIVLHLMGTHSSYKKRYPKKYSQFKDRIYHPLKLSDDQWEAYNEYDNAVLYNDFIVNRFIETIRPLKNSKLLYFSDHGEEVFDTHYVSGHTESIGSNPMFEVPFIIWPQHKFKVADKLNALWSTEDLIHTLHDFLGIKTTYYDPARSILAPEFKEIPRKAGFNFYHAEEGKVDCVAKSGFNPKAKIWLHRVNSDKRLELLLNDYEGFETDLVWDGKKLDVGHPPEPSINLSLEKLIAVDKKKEKDFWFDLKNLTPDNAPDVLRELIRLDQLFSIKGRSITESDNAEALKLIHDAGFMTSFYLPELTVEDPVGYFNKVHPRIQPYHSFISQNGSMMEYLDAKFTGCDKLVWLLKDDRETKKKIEELKGRDDVKVILVRERSNYYR
jgi:heptose-I-phosphate ethanolaminephosphotransferase